MKKKSQENETHKILWDFEKENQLIPVKRPDFELISKILAVPEHYTLKI